MSDSLAIGGLLFNGGTFIGEMVPFVTNVAIVQAREL